MTFRPRFVRHLHHHPTPDTVILDGRLSVPFSALILGVASLFAGPSYASNAVPDWVHAAAAEVPPSLPTSTKAVVLLDEETYTISADGRATLHVRLVTKILRPQGRDEAYPFVSYDKDSKVTFMHVWSIDPAGHEYTVKDNEIVDLGARGEAGELYSDQRARAATPPGRDPGGIVALEYERRERPYLAETNWFFQGDLPRLNQSFTLVLPPASAIPPLGAVTRSWNRRNCPTTLFAGASLKSQRSMFLRCHYPPVKARSRLA